MAASLTTIALLTLTVALLVTSVRATIGDPDVVADAVDSAIADPAVRDEILTELANAIESNLLGTTSLELAEGLEVEATSGAVAVAQTLLEDPDFRAALTDIVYDTHTLVLIEHDDLELDVGELTRAALAVIAIELPDAQTPANATLYRVPADDIPDLTDVGNLFGLIVPGFTVGGFLLLTAALAHPHRHRIGAWTGRWLMVMGLIAALMAVGLPAGGGWLTGLATVEAVLRSLTSPLLGPAMLAGVLGIGLASAASMSKKREESATSDEGAAVALGVNQPIPDWLVHSAPNQPRGELIDATRPLTNL